MKICQLCAVDFTLYHFLLPLMEATKSAGHEVVGVSAGGPLLEKVRECGFRVEAVPFVRSTNPARNLRAFRALLSLFRRERFDLVHVHTPVASVVGRVAAAMTGVDRVVYTAHGFFFHDRMPRLRRWPFVTLEWCAGRLTDTMFTQAEEDARSARRMRLCRTGDVLAIGNGSDPARFHPADSSHEKASLRRRIGTPSDRIVIAAIGRLVAEKGYPELIAAMRSVDAELWVIGERLSSDHAPDIDDFVRAAQIDPALRDRIRFLGYRDDVPDLLRAADIFTLPSHREGMPRSIVEAMLTGLPVVATDIRGSREEVVDGETGFLVPVGSSASLAAALRRLIAEPLLRADLGIRGRRRALELFDEGKVIRRQLDHLQLAA